MMMGINHERAAELTRLDTKVPDGNPYFTGADADHVVEWPAGPIDLPPQVRPGGRLALFAVLRGVRGVGFDQLGKFANGLRALPYSSEADFGGHLDAKALDVQVSEQAPAAPLTDRERGSSMRATEMPSGFFEPVALVEPGTQESPAADLSQPPAPEA